MKRIIKYGILGCISVCAMVSCDTREDWFAKEGEGATFVFVDGRSGRMDTIDMVGLREVEYTLHLVGVEPYKVSKENYDIWSDTLNLQVYGMTNRTKVPAKISSLVASYGGSYPIRKDHMQDGSINLYYDGGRGDSFVFVEPQDNKERASILGYSDLFVRLKDIFENEYTGHIRIMYSSDCPPTPVLKIKDVSGKPMEKTLDLSDSYDEDGSVVKYEYCIDGNIAKYTGTANRFEKIEGVWQGGKAAYGGTYITATAISEINHAFQEAGEHTIYYRCMDNLGAWSLWNKKTITIK